MLFEYAVEPQAIASDWQLFKYLIEKFGFDRGRLVSQFPKAWQRLVYDLSRGLTDVDRKRVAELLSRAKGSLVLSGRPYDPALGDWLTNAMAQQAAQPFHAIIADRNPTNHPSVLVAEDIDETTPLFQTTHGWKVQRTGAALAVAMQPLLCHASEIWFVDKYFNLLDRRYTETLGACLRTVASSGNVVEKCQIHYCEHDRRPPMAEVERGIPRSLRGIIPKGMKISLHVWRERPGGEDFHARYLLTNRGGLSVDSGFSAAGDHQMVDVHLLSPAVWQSGRDALAGGGAYDQDGPVLEIDADCNIVRRVAVSGA